MTVRPRKPRCRWQEVARKPRRWLSTRSSSSIHIVTPKKTSLLRHMPSYMTSQRIWPKERKKFLSKGHPHLRVSPLTKRYGWGIHNNVAGKIALIAVESSRYKQVLDDPHTTKVKAFRSTRA